MRHSDKDDWHRGNYKSTTNSVVAYDGEGVQLGVIFEASSPFETPLQMAALVEWVRSQREAQVQHPLLLVCIFIVVFLAIHPFQDGNGRLSRALTTLLLLQAGYAYVPYSSLESIIERDKQGYYLALRQTQASLGSGQPDWQPWLLFFLRALHEQSRRLQAKLERELGVLTRLPALSLQIVELAREHGRVTMADAIAVTGASRHTLKPHFRALVERGQLAREGQGRGVWYRLN